LSPVAFFKKKRNQRLGQIWRAPSASGEVARFLFWLHPDWTIFLNLDGTYKKWTRPHLAADGVTGSLWRCR
jgi:hypothetical protein